MGGATAHARQYRRTGWCIVMKWGIPAGIRMYQTVRSYALVRPSPRSRCLSACVTYLLTYFPVVVVMCIP